MADHSSTQRVPHDDMQTPSGGSFGTLANIAGAGLSLALLVGVGIWGYQLMVRDVSGIPVVRAVEGPMRVQPEDPGGRPADHQGLAVNAVAADGSAAAPADRLVLAPPPVSLTAEDAPLSQIQPVRAAVAAPEAPATPLSQSDQIDALVAEITQGAATLDLTEVSVTASVPPIVAPAPLILDGYAPSPEPAARAAVPTPQPAVAREVPGVVRSPRPQRRPAGGAPAMTVAVGTAPAPALDLDPAQVPAGTRVVQLGAYENADIARGEWERLSARFSDYLGDKQRIVQEAQSGGRIFFRLRAHGFEDLSDARRFCSVLVAEGADCIPVVTR